MSTLGGDGITCYALTKLVPRSSCAALALCLSKLKKSPNCQFFITPPNECLRYIWMAPSQFVNFTISIVSAEEIKTPEQSTAAHQIIFQRYCLAFSDRDQLLFQTFIVMHYKILLGLYTEDDMKAGIFIFHFAD